MCRPIALHIDGNYQRRTHISRRLDGVGFDIHYATTSQKARELARKNIYSIILAHIDVLGREILDFCRFIRTGCDDTILIALLNKTRITIEEKLFDCGVNDVVVGEQTTARVLIKRIRAHLNNTHPNCVNSNTIRLKDTLVDLDQKQVWCNGMMKRLPGILADLLKYFLDNPGRPISREELRQSHIWEESICSTAEEGGKTFDVHIGRLRRIIEPDPNNPKIIQVVRGAGWKLAVRACALTTAREDRRENKISESKTMNV